MSEVSYGLRLRSFNNVTFHGYRTVDVVPVLTLDRAACSKLEQKLYNRCNNPNPDNHVTFEIATDGDESPLFVKFTDSEVWIGTKHYPGDLA